jgi:peroxiredoxin
MPQVGFQAPDFELENSTGETIRLSELRGRPVLVNVWASWCPPCRAEMPAMQTVYQQYQDQGFIVLAVNATDQDDRQDALDFAQEWQLSFPILFDTQGQVSRQYQVRSLPTSFFIDPQGVIREVVVGGPMAEALLRIRVEQLLEPGFNQLGSTPTEAP